MSKDVMMFSHGGDDYELKMTRSGVAMAEEHGLNTTDMREKPFSAAYGLFFAALYSKYRVTPNKARGMLDDLLDNKVFTFEAIYETLVESYTELFGSGEPEEPKTKK